MRSWTTSMARIGSLALALSLIAAASAGAEETKAPADGADQTAAAGESSNWEDHPYIVKDGKVDYGTYDGYRRYAGICHVCHGPDAMGSSFAPALKDSLKTMSYSEFLDVVTNGKQNVSNSQNLVMPSFADNANVMLNIDHIYAYLKARADGAIGRGRPERLPPEEDPVWKEWKASQQ